jgi:hypothetical protein
MAVEHFKKRKYIFIYKKEKASVEADAFFTNVARQNIILDKTFLQG